MSKRAPKKAAVDPARKLAIARAQLKVYRAAVRVPAGVEVPSILRDPSAPSRFIQCWTVQRGYASITQALDEDGQVWERHVDIPKGEKIPRDSWWETVSMERRKAGPVASPEATG